MCAPKRAASTGRRLSYKIRLVINWGGVDVRRTSLVHITLNDEEPKFLREKTDLNKSPDKKEPIEVVSSQRSLSNESPPIDGQSPSTPLHTTLDEPKPLAGPRFVLNLAKPHVTYAMIAINFVVFLAMIAYGYLYYGTWQGPETMGVLVDFGAKVNDLIVEGQTWRLLTATFIHIGVMHLLFNLYALYAFGPMVEGYFGHYRYLAIYLIAGLLGSIASFAFSSAVSAGASGAVFGLAGAIIVYFLRYRDNFGRRGRAILQNMFMVIGLNLVFGLSMSGIDNWGHMGGLVGGMLGAWGLLPRYAKLDTIHALPPSGPDAKPIEIAEEDRTTWNVGWIVFCGVILWLLFQYASQITPLLLTE